jgi:hypothetical protein
MNGILFDSERSVWVDPPELALADRVVHHTRDWFLEDLAVEARTNANYAPRPTCYFVSTDAPTRTNFGHVKLAALGLQAMKPKDAIAAAEERCDQGLDSLVLRSPWSADSNAAHSNTKAATSPPGRRGARRRRG